jgi:hypothetical protein
VWGSLAALLYGSPANPDKNIEAAFVHADAGGALAYSPAESGFVLASQDQSVSLAEPDTKVAPDASAAFPDPGVRLAAVEPNGRVKPVQTSDECFLESCIDQYLWSVYERTPKLDTVKVEERISVAVTSKSKRRNITKTVTKLVDEDFTWKDPAAAQKASMSMPQYVIGGMDKRFKLKLYHLLRALDEAGLEPGITSAFRDNYRQLIAAGKKATSDNSYHGGSRHGGYGHGLAADLVSVKGETRSDRQASSDELWQWVDVHGKQFGIGRPYLDKDPPHVGPIDGTEYAYHRAVNVRRAGLKETVDRHHVNMKRAGL